MSVNLSVIYRMIHDGEVIAACVRSRRRADEDLQATIALLSKTGWTQDNRRLLSYQIWSLRQAFKDIDEGLKIHCSCEAKPYTPALSAALAAVLESDHQEILLQLDKIRQMLEGVADRNIRRKYPGVHKEIEIFCRLLDIHNEKEKAMLLKLKDQFEIQGQ
jgi:hypothetical protein